MFTRSASALTLALALVSAPVLAGDPTQRAQADTATKADIKNEAPETPKASSAVTEGTALPVRKEKPLTLAQESSGTSATFKLASLALIVAGAFYVAKKRGLKLPRQAVQKPMKVTARTSLGVRSELVVVEVDGQRLVLGVTPSNISLVTTLEANEPAEEAPPAKRTSKQASHNDAEQLMSEFRQRSSSIPEDPEASEIRIQSIASLLKVSGEEAEQLAGSQPPPSRRSSSSIPVARDSSPALHVPRESMSMPIHRAIEAQRETSIPPSRRSASAAEGQVAGLRKARKSA